MIQAHQPMIADGKIEATKIEPKNGKHIPKIVIFIFKAQIKI